MGGRRIVTFFTICTFLVICNLPRSHGAKRRYFKFGGNWKSWKEDANSLAKSRSISGRRSLPDLYTVHTETRDVLENSQVELTCSVDRERYPKIRWSRYGQPLPTSVQENDDKITFPFIQLGDAGTYVCTASNDWDTKEVHIKLTVHPSDRFREQIGGTVSQCRPDQATCRSGECILRSDLCDGELDCRDGSDEYNCGQSLAVSGECQPNEHKCNNGRCIQRMWVCDGDDDCGDRSDEHNCGQRQPGELCAPYEFKCRSQNQCVPLAYQCDKNNDCFDGSDEVGCAGPTVVEPPKRDVVVRCGEDIVLTCRTIGVPVPYVNWRLNWGPVCSPPRCTQTSVNGFGTLTIHNAQPGDQGAYTCEAVNVVNRVLATPDAIVRVYGCGPDPGCNPAGSLPSTGDGVCHCKQQATGPRCDHCVEGSFYLNERNPYGCIKCFCSGVTRVCQSSDWYRTQERLIFTLDDQDVELADRDKTAPVLDFDHTAYRGYITHAGRHVGTLYWHMPKRLLGNKLTAYGGRLTFSFRFSGSGAARQRPLVILRGHDLTAVYQGLPSYEPERTHNVVIEMYESFWTREDGQPMTREHFLMLLSGLDSFLIRATHAEVDTSSSLGEVTLDVAVQFGTQQEQALAVEKCQCPEGYRGLSCEDCAPGYQRSPGLYLGTCVAALVRVTVRVEPRFQEQDEGATVRFRAIIEGGIIGPFTFMWSKVGYPELPQNAIAVQDVLTLSDIRIEDYGTYRVVVTAGGGTGAGEAELRVRRVGVCPYVWVEPISLWHGQPGERAEFHCKAIGEPTPRLYWVRADGRPLDVNARDHGDGSLVIDNVNPNNYGQYVCHGENRAGKNTVNATVAEGGAAQRRITIRIEPSNTIASKRYDTIQVRCVGSGVPTPTVAWRREDGSPLHSNAQDLGNGILRIIGIEKINAGLYRCTAQNTFTQATDIANILPPTDIRSTLPVVVVSPREQDVAVGDQVRIDCGAIADSRDPTPRIVWSRKGGGDLDANVTDLGDGILRIPNFQPHHAGVYECTAFGVHSKATETASLRLKSDTAPSSRQAPPVPEVTPKIQTVAEGEQAEFVCKVEGTSTGTTLAWGYMAADGLLPINVHDEDGRLIIEAVEHLVNEGQYFCTASNAFGSSSASGSLYVERAPMAPKVKIEPDTRWKGQTGSNITFTCTANGFPPPVVAWSREGPLAFGETANVDSDGGLTIINLKSTDAGKYTCTATNSAGEDRATATVDLESKVFAKILHNGKEAGNVITVEENSPLKLECIGTGDPEPKIGWIVDMGPSRGDVPKGYKPVEIFNEFVVHDKISRANEGIYKCEARNEFGHTESNVKIQVVPRGKREVVILGGSERTAVAGSRLELRCLLTDLDLKYSLRWVRKSPHGAPLPNHHRQSQGLLTIPEFHDGDAGVYECQARDVASGFVVNWDEVKIVAPGASDSLNMITVEDGPIVYVEEGDALELKCNARATSDDSRSELQWFSISQGSFYPITKGVFSNGIFHIGSVSMEDAGVYSCVRYFDGHRDGSYQIAVIASNTETTAKQVHSKTNELLELRCPVVGISGMSYDWKRVNAIQMPAGIRTDQRALRFTDFKSEDAGTYVCEVAVNGGRAKGYVQVVDSEIDKLANVFIGPLIGPLITAPTSTFPTTLLTTPETQSTKKPYLELKLSVSPEFAFPGKDVTLNCSLNAEPTAQIRWERIGRPLPRTAYITGQQLKLRKLQTGDNGRYRCIASTKKGPMSVETVLSIGEKLSTNAVRRYYDL